MSGSERSACRYLDQRPGQPLIAIPWQDGDEEVVRYFVDEGAAREFGARQPGADAMSVFGAWSDLDADEFDDWFEMVRLERKPMPDDPEEREILAARIHALRERFAGTPYAAVG
jgi:hypothetical protein